MTDIMTNKAAAAFRDQWLIYDYWQRADNPAIRIDAKYDTSNVQVHDGQLKMLQKAYKQGDSHISMSGVQSRKLDIGHGTFRVTFKLEGATGGSCASFFWYRDDNTEVDIEAVTQGTSKVNNTINYTTQPSLNADGTHIFNATHSLPLSPKFNTDLERFHEHRFDIATDTNVRYFLDGQLMHIDSHNTPNHQMGGNLQVKLWADGNKWWSGHPSSTDVTMSVKSIIAYYNTTETSNDINEEWIKTCKSAGGPSDNTICRAFAVAGKDDNQPLSGKIPTRPPALASVSKLPRASATQLNPVGPCYNPRCLNVNSASRLGSSAASYITGVFNTAARLLRRNLVTNSTPVKYKNDWKHDDKQLQRRVSDHLPIENSKNDVPEKCRDYNNKPCAEQGTDAAGMVQVWKCILQREDICIFWNTASLFSKGVVQVVSVPFIFAWVFYVSEF